MEPLGAVAPLCRCEFVAACERCLHRSLLNNAAAFASISPSVSGPPAGPARLPGVIPNSLATVAWYDSSWACWDCVRLCADTAPAMGGVHATAIVIAASSLRLVRMTMLLSCLATVAGVGSASLQSHVLSGATERCQSGARRFTPEFPKGRAERLLPLSRRGALARRIWPVNDRVGNFDDDIRRHSDPVGVSAHGLGVAGLVDADGAQCAALSAIT
jgi:hypothetical protein